MKKSQILAALALAFSLGVVAPVAGLVNTASAITITEGGVVTANRQDVIDTVKAIEGQTEYQQYKALVDALNLKVNNKTVSDLATTTPATTLKGEIVALSNASDYAYKNYKLLTAADGYTNAQIMEDAADTAKAAIAVVSGKSYNLWSSLYVAMNNTDTKNNSEDTLAGAIVSAAQALGMTVSYDATKDNLSDVQAEVNTTSYTNYAGMIANINTVEDKLSAVETKVEALKAALAPFANATAIADASAATNNTPIADLEALQSHATRLTNYQTLIADVNNVNKNLANESYTGYDGNTIAVVDQLKGDYKAASGSDLVVSGGTVTDPTNPGATVRTLTSQNGDITVTGAFETGVEVMAGPVTTNVFGDQAYEAYDITLWKDGKQYTDFNGTAFVTIKLSKVNAAKSSVYYVNGNEKTALETTRGEKTVSFYTTHFSVYAAVEDGTAAGEEDPSAPGTGIVSPAEGNAATTVSIVAGLATALTALGAGVVAYRSARRSNK